MSDEVKHVWAVAFRQTGATMLMLCRTTFETEADADYFRKQYFSQIHPGWAKAWVIKLEDPEQE